MSSCAFIVNTVSSELIPNLYKNGAKIYDILLPEAATVPFALDYRVHVLFNDVFKLN
jgi:hypothetical protein